MADNNHSGARARDFAQDDPFAELARIVGDDSFLNSRRSPHSLDDLALDLEQELMDDFSANVGTGLGTGLDSGQKDTGTGAFPGSRDDIFGSYQTGASDPVFGTDFSDKDFGHAPSQDDNFLRGEELEFNEADFARSPESQGNWPSDSWAADSLPTDSLNSTAAQSYAGQPDPYATQAEQHSDFFSAEHLSDFEQALSRDMTDNFGAFPQADMQTQPVEPEWHNEPAAHTYVEPGVTAASPEMPLDSSRLFASETDADFIQNTASHHDDATDDPFAGFDFGEEFTSPAEPVAQEQGYYAEASVDNHAQHYGDTPAVAHSHDDDAFFRDFEQAMDFSTDEPAEASSSFEEQGYEQAHQHQAYQDDHQAYHPVDQQADQYADQHSEMSSWQQEPTWASSEDVQSWQAGLGDVIAADPATANAMSSSAAEAIANAGYGLRRDNRVMERSEPPQVDTVEISDGPIVATEPLDLPHIPYREEIKASSHLDEFDDLLAGAFGQTFEHSRNAAPEEAAAPQQQNPDFLEFDFSEFESTPFTAENQGQGSASDHAGFQQRPAFFDGVPGNDQADGYMGGLHPQPGTPQPQGRRKSLLTGRSTKLAAAVAGIALIGAVSLYMVFGGGLGNQEVALIRAGESEIKVRPENPGGTTIPNQENQVYRSVERNSDATTGEAGRLVTAAEEPIHLPQNLDEENAGLNAAGEDNDIDLFLKNEERLEATDESAGIDAVATVTPRRVRSFVVRPDGTMVQNEAPQEVAAAPQPAAPTVDAITQPVPDTVPIPAPRPQQPAAQTAPVSQTQTAVVQTPATQTPPAVTTTAPSGWSVQVSSQASLEAAQQSYQQLMQRHGNLLQGRGVNIVKAEIDGRGTYFRVRIPSSSKDDAVNLCEKLKSAGGSCFVSQ